MDQNRFATATRPLTCLPSRRNVLRGLAGLGLGVGGARRSGAAAARKKPKPNAYGCLDVGQPCGGRDDRCCSGICEGKRPRKGRRDRSRCAAHNTGGCTPERSYCAVGAQFAGCGPSGNDIYCFATTGKAGFCTDYPKFKAPQDCHACETDPDCEAIGYPPGSACILVASRGFCGDTCDAASGRGCAAPYYP